MKFVRHSVHTVTNADGSYTIHVGDNTFGPYGPGQCEAVHPAGRRNPEGVRCRHNANHMGCHTADLPIPPGTKVTKHVEAAYTLRW